jgi:peptide deformylase
VAVETERARRRSLAVLPIRFLPDPVLRQRTKPVKVFDGQLKRLVEDMTETMRAAGGVGLAANQIGVPLRVCVIEIPEAETGKGQGSGNEFYVLINPVVLRREGERELEEGCLSIPEYRGGVRRSRMVRVRAQDLSGKTIRIKAQDNLLAQVLEHEIDHLNGVLYIDHLVSKDAIWKLPEAEPPREKADP